MQSMHIQVFAIRKVLNREEASGHLDYIFVQILIVSFVSSTMNPVGMEKERHMMHWVLVKLHITIRISATLGLCIPMMKEKHGSTNGQWQT